MSLLDDVQSAQTTGSSRCTVCILIESLDPDDAAELVDVLAKPGLQGSAIATVLDRRGWHVRGHRLSGQTVNRHRRGLCSG